MEKKKIATALTGVLLLFYMGIISFVFVAILDAFDRDNGIAAMIFEIIGFLFLAVFVLKNIVDRTVKYGYFVPLITVTVIYTVILDYINMVLIDKISNKYFILINLVVLFLYCLVSVPMYLMGRKIVEEE